jgi:hypothetical protein
MSFSKKRRNDMKMKKVLSIVIALVLVLSCNVSGVSAETQLRNYTIDKPYEYPITPYDDEWKLLETKLEGLKLCQIPNEILHNLTTEALLETVLNYPFLIDYHAYNSYKQAAEKFMKTFNGFKELYGRPDLRQVLLYKYEKSVPMEEFEAYEMKCDVVNGDYTSVSNTKEFCNRMLETSNIEFLIACDQLLNGDYSESEAAALDGFVYQKKQLREDSVLYSDYSNTYANIIIKNKDIAPIEGKKITY